MSVFSLPDMQAKNPLISGHCFAAGRIQTRQQAIAKQLQASECH
jgi:hypothetical protein